MTITINDARSMSKVVLRPELIPGNMYVNSFGQYVIMTDESFLIDIQTGIAFAVNEYGKNDEFTPIKCELEVYA